MTLYRTDFGGTRRDFGSLKACMAQASPRRSGDELAGIAAPDEATRIAAAAVLADLPLTTFLTEALIPYEDDEVTRLIVDSHDAAAFAPVRSLTVGGFREWLLSEAADAAALTALAPGLTPEMVAAASITGPRRPTRESPTVAGTRSASRSTASRASLISTTMDDGSRCTICGVWAD